MTMALITSATETEALNQRPLSTVAESSSKTTGDFSDVLNQAFSATSEDMDTIFEEAAKLFDLPVNLLKAVAKTESGFNPNAVSRSGAMGVMQLMPQTAKSLGVTDPFDARQNIIGGAKYLKSTLDQFGDVTLALAAYNAGPGSVMKYGGVPPFAETQDYVRKVASYMEGDDLLANQTVQTKGAVSDVVADIVKLSQMNRTASLLSGLNDSDSGTGLLGGLGSFGSVGSLLGSDDSDSLFGGDSYLNSLMGLGSGNINSMMSSLAMAAMASSYGGGSSYGMDQEGFSSLVQMLRIQMMMQADKAAGFMDL